MSATTVAGGISSMSTQPQILRGTITWIDEKKQTGIITQADSPIDLFFGFQDVIIGTPAKGKTAQFTRKDDKQMGAVAKNIAILDDLARGAPMKPAQVTW
ncbi:MAG: hypothetical protein ACT4P5_15565, partial [Armatimonadota bacterium]